jgi:hypothetical protein
MILNEILEFDEDAHKRIARIDKRVRIKKRKAI